LRDAASDVVAHDARAIDVERVEQSDDAIAVRAQRQRTAVGRIAAPVAEQVDDDQAVSRGHERNDIAPQMSRRGKSMKEDDRLADAAGSSGVVVEPHPVQIDELTAHGGGVGCGPGVLMRARSAFGKMTSPRIRDKR